MKTAMYIFVNNGLGMSAGKVGAQTAHAAVEIYRRTINWSPKHIERYEHWFNTGYTKLVMEARDTEHILLIERVLKDKGYKTALIIDEGRTEIDPQTPTALAVEVVDRADEQVAFDFADFKTLKPPKPEPRKAPAWWWTRP